MPGVTTALELIDRVWDEAIECGEMAVVDEALSNDYVLRTPGAPEPIRGPDGFERDDRALRTAFPDLTADIVDGVVAENVAEFDFLDVTTQLDVVDPPGEQRDRPGPGGSRGPLTTLYPR